MNLNKQLDNAAFKNPFAYGLTYVDLLQNRKWQLGDRKWLPEIYAQVNPYEIEKTPVGPVRKLVVMKATQVGITTLALVKMLHFADYWPVRVMYMLPRQQDYIDFVNTRLDPMINASERLKTALGFPNSTRSKKFGQSYLFFMESTVEPRMMPADAVFVDEVDLSEPDNIDTLFNRMDDSPWKLAHYFSTPTLPNYGIHGRYIQSDMRRWMVPCPHCGYQQILDWEKNVLVRGPHNDPKEVHYICQKCRGILIQPDIQKGAWVAERPEKSDELIGYHISQMMKFQAIDLWRHFVDPHQTIKEFYRKRLGTPYEVEGGSVDRDTIIASCFSDLYGEEMGHDGESTYYMGLDQANELQAIIAKIPPGHKRPQIVKIEPISFERGFERVRILMRLFKICRLVADADPNRHAVRNLQVDFPGRVIMADYLTIRERFTTQKKMGITVHVSINRTESFDDLMESIRAGTWQLYGDPSRLNSDLELLIAHTTSLKRDVEERKTRSGTIQAAVWRKLGPDHFAHAWLYLKTAIEIDKGKGFRSAVISSQKKKEEKSKSNVDEMTETLGYAPHKAIIPDLVAIFAEVPPGQIRKYLTELERKGVKEPAFPLSYKLKRAGEQFDKRDIRWMLEFIAVHGHDPVVL